MKKLLTLFGTLMLFAGLRAKAQKTHQPVKKETTKPVNSQAPRPAAADTYLKMGDIKGDHSAYLKNTKPAALKGSNPASTPQATPRQTTAPAVSPATPRRTGSKG